MAKIETAPINRVAVTAFVVCIVNAQCQVLSRNKRDSSQLPKHRDRLAG